MKRKSVYIIVVLLLVCATIFGGMYLNEKSIDNAYKNTVPLYAYTLAQLEYNSENRYMRTVNDYLELIPADYSGELCEEIKTFTGNFKRYAKVLGNKT